MMTERNQFSLFPVQPMTDVLPDAAENIATYRALDKLSRTGQVESALDLVDRQYGLQLDPLSRRAFELMLGKAIEVPRFAGNENIAPSRKGSVAQHTLMVMPMIGALTHLAYADAGHEVTSSFNSQAWPAPREAVRDMMHDQMVQVLMHDFGEIFIELSSLSQRRRSELKAELPSVERKFAEFGLRLAYHCVLSHRTAQAQEKAFGDVIDDVREQISTSAHKDEVAVGEGIAKTISAAIEPHIDTLHLDVLPRDVLARLRHYMGAYDEPEGFSHLAQFNGRVVKHAQNMQTVLHIVEHAGKDGAPPYNLASSGEVTNCFWYAERGLPAIVQAQRAGNPLHAAMTRACTQLAYAIGLAVIHIPIPEVIDRAPKQRESEPTEAAQREREISQAKLLWRDIASGMQDFSCGILHRDQLRLAYQAALHLSEKGQSFVPSADSLAKISKLPLEIQAAWGQGGKLKSSQTVSLIKQMAARPGLKLG